MWDEWCCFTPDVTDDFKRRLAGEHLLAAADDGPPPSAIYDPRVDGSAYVPTPAALPPAPAPTLVAVSSAASTPAPSPAAVAAIPGGFKAAFRSGFAPVALNAAGAGESTLAGEEVDEEVFGEGEEEDVDGEDVDGVDVDGEEMEGVAPEVEVVEVDVDGEGMEYESDTDRDIFG